MTWPVGAAIVVALSGVVWALLLALEWALARGSRSRVSDASLAAYARDAMRESAPQYVSWPKQRKGAAGYWDRRPAKLRDVSRRAS